MNHVAFYAGLMKTLKVSHACLDPEDFIVPEQDISSASTSPLSFVEGDLEVFPVPADKYLNVKLDPGRISGDAELHIFDTSGQLCLKEVNLELNTSLHLDTSGYRDGIYLLRITSDGLSEYKRFVVVH